MSVHSDFIARLAPYNPEVARGSFASLRNVVTIGLVFLLALMSRLALLSHAPIYDELYQILPSLSWHADQTFNVLDGSYDRGAVFSKFIAFNFGLSGSSTIEAARLGPSVVPGVLLVAVVFAWTLYVCGPLAAFIVAFFLILWPNGIGVSQYVRFYALQGLCFTAGAVLTYTAATGQLSVLWRSICAGLACALWFFALHLQMLTVLGAGAVFVWIVLMFGPKILRQHPFLWWGVAALVVGGIGILASGIFADQLRWLWVVYNWESWPVQNDTTFYHRYFRDNYPTFWTLFPIAAIIALKVNFKPASFCITLFVITFLLQSFGGLKGVRYLYPTMPFFFVVWAITLQALLPAIWNTLNETAKSIWPEWLPDRFTSFLGFACTAVALLFLVGGNAAVVRGAKLALGSDENKLLGKTRWEWTEAEAMAAPWLQKRALIVTSEELRAITTIGDYDLAYNKPRFSEMLFAFGPDTQPFVRDFRNGRPIIGEFSDMLSVVLCNPVGVLLMDRPGASSGNVINLVEAANDFGIATTIDRRAGTSLLGWEHPIGFETDQDCTAIMDFGDVRAADRINDGRSVPQVIAVAKPEG